MKQPKSPHFMILAIQLRLRNCNDCYLEVVVPNNWWDMTPEKQIAYLKKLERKHIDFNMSNNF